MIIWKGLEKMKELIKADIKGLTVKLWEDLVYSNIIGCSVYVLLILDSNGDIYIEELGDNKEKALDYYKTTLSDIIDIGVYGRGDHFEDY